jgi:hypothetical protein
MKIFCESAGDPSVGISRGEIVIDIKGLNEEDFSKEELSEILEDSKDFAENFFGEPACVATESQMEEERREEDKMFEVHEAVTYQESGYQLAEWFF